jgi:hypothetical protein
MMPKRDKPFVIYQGGRLSYMIVPQGVMGWMQFAIWLSLLVPLFAWFITHCRTHEGADLVFGLVLLIFGILFWLVGGIWWMSARARTVDVSVLQRDRQRQRQRERLERLRKESIDPP